MRLGVPVVSSLAVFVAAVVACSSDSSQPGELGDCIATDATTCTAISGSSGGGDDGSACTVSAGTSQCGACETAKCCDPLEKCAADEACANLLSCENDCAGVGTCFTACEGQFPTGQATLTNLSDCVLRDCTVCDQSGVGDPCGADDPACVVGLTCSLWCTEVCNASSDCAGLGAGGANTAGLANVCLLTSAGVRCVPTCSLPGDCADFPGTYCLTTTAIDGSTVAVCSPLPEASTHD